MARPAGGLAPGEGWKQDGISWTPQTSLYAWVAAGTGDRATAEGWLSWIDAHRTPSGAIPEKVLADGAPAAVAPLSWSAACVLLALDELDSRGALTARAGRPAGGRAGRRQGRPTGSPAERPASALKSRLEDDLDAVARVRLGELDRRDPELVATARAEASRSAAA